MKNLKRLTAALALSLMLGLSAFAGETQTPPCDPSPGETQGPPCSSNQFTGESTAPGQMDAPPLSLMVNVAVDLLEGLLTF